MDVPLYPIIVTVVEECSLAFKKTIVGNLNDSIIFAFPKIGIGFLVCLLFFVVYPPSSSRRKRTSNIDKFLLTYNTTLTLCHAYVCFRCMNLWIRVVHWVCEYEDMFSLRISSVQENVVDVTEPMYFFSIIKLVELLNTIFAIVLVKNRSALFLNFYEQTMLILACWTCFMFYSNSHAALLFMSGNSCVHILKYVYYGSSIFFQVSGMWTQLLFKRVLKLIALVQYAVLLLLAGYLLIIDDSVATIVRTLIFVNAILVVFILTKY